MRSSRVGQEWEPKHSEKSGVAGKVFIIIIVCVFIYFISAGAVGKWIAQNIVTPVLSLFEENGDSPVESENPSATSSASSASSASSSASKDTEGNVSEKILLPDLSVYALQTGAYAEQANADTAAAAAKERGGAGYILTDGNIRVMLSAYKTQEEAKSVADNLAATEAYETVQYEISAKGVTFDITAHQGDIDSIKNFFKLVETSHTSLNELSVSFDKKEITADDVQLQTSQLNKDVQSFVDSVSAMTDNGENALSNMKDFAVGMQGCLTVDVANKTDVEISSQLKYNYIWLSDLYKKFIDGFK